MHQLRTTYCIRTIHGPRTTHGPISSYYILQLIQTIHDHGHGMSIGP